MKKFLSLLLLVLSFSALAVEENCDTSILSHDIFYFTDSKGVKRFQGYSLDKAVTHKVATAMLGGEIPTINDINFNNLDEVQSLIFRLVDLQNSREFKGQSAERKNRLKVILTVLDFYYRENAANKNLDFLIVVKKKRIPKSFIEDYLHLAKRKLDMRLSGRKRIVLKERDKSALEIIFRAYLSLVKKTVRSKKDITHGDFVSKLNELKGVIHKEQTVWGARSFFSSEASTPYAFSILNTFDVSLNPKDISSGGLFFSKSLTKGIYKIFRENIIYAKTTIDFHEEFTKKKLDSDSLDELRECIVFLGRSGSKKHLELLELTLKNKFFKALKVEIEEAIKRIKSRK